MFLVFLPAGTQRVPSKNASQFGLAVWFAIANIYMNKYISAKSFLSLPYMLECYLKTFHFVWQKWVRIQPENFFFIVHAF